MMLAIDLMFTTDVMLTINLMLAIDLMFITDLIVTIDLMVTTDLLFTTNLMLTINFMFKTNLLKAIDLLLTIDLMRDDSVIFASSSANTEVAVTTMSKNMPAIFLSGVMCPISQNLSQLNATLPCSD